MEMLILDAEAFKRQLVEEILKFLPQQQKEKRWLRSSMVCEMLDISPSLLQQLRIHGDIPAVKLSTGTWLYPYQGVVDALEAKTIGRKEVKHG